MHVFNKNHENVATFLFKVYINISNIVLNVQ